MQYTTALSLYLLAVAGPVSIFAQVDVTVWESETMIVTVTADPGAPTPPANNGAGVQEKVADPQPPAVSSSSPPPPSSAAASSAPASSGSPGGNLQSHDGQICVNFSGNDDFHWLNTGSWGSTSGYGSQNASQCFTPSANAGMFICESECQDSGDSSTAKYTKLECTLGGTWQNCDISLVDGFSLPLQCTIPNAKPYEKIGGLTDLDSLNSCQTKGDDNTCKNANAYGPNSSGVQDYFLAANYNEGNFNGNNYCVFQFCSAQSDIFFSDQPTIECVVGKRGAASSSTSKRDADKNAAAQQQQQEAALAARSQQRHRHSHGHAHAKGLKDIGI